MKISLVVSVLINVVLAYIILKPSPEVSNMETYLLERISKENSIKRDKIMRDSLRIANEIKIRDKKINNLNYLRKNERNLYQLELSKIQLLNSDSSYAYALDSIKKVCCSNSTSR